MENKKILIVDDEEFMLFAMSHHLRQIGYEVVTAMNGFEAIQRTEKEKPDLVVLDIMMPYLSGLEFLNWLRHSHTPGNTPVILISSLTEKEVKSAGYDLGNCFYIYKPFTMDELAIAIKAFIDSEKNKEDLSVT